MTGVVKPPTQSTVTEAKECEAMSVKGASMEQHYTAPTSNVDHNRRKFDRACVKNVENSTGVCHIVRTMAATV